MGDAAGNSALCFHPPQALEAEWLKHFPTAYKVFATSWDVHTGKKDVDV